MITSIVFDVDDTIYDQQAPYRIAMEKCFPDFDMSHMNQAYIRFRHYSDVGFPRVMAGEWTTEYFRFWRCKETLLEFGYREIDEETGNHFQEVYEHELENITMLDEMRMTLDFLKEKNVPMGIITNGPSEHQWSKVKALGVERWIDKENIIVSGDYSINKPDVRIFEIMQEKLQLPIDSLYYIGDSLENDIVGANNAGWKAIWINRYKRKLPGNVKIYKIAENNIELFEIIKEIFEK